MKNKLIFEFSKNKTDGDSSLNNLLGGKGANLAEMSNMQIPVHLVLQSQQKCVTTLLRIKNSRIVWIMKLGKQ